MQVVLPGTSHRLHPYAEGIGQSALAMVSRAPALALSFFPPCIQAVIVVAERNSSMQACHCISGACSEWAMAALHGGMLHFSNNFNSRELKYLVYAGRQPRPDCVKAGGALQLDSSGSQVSA